MGVGVGGVPRAAARLLTAPPQGRVARQDRAWVDACAPHANAAVGAIPLGRIACMACGGGKPPRPPPRALRPAGGGIYSYGIYVNM